MCHSVFIENGIIQNGTPLGALITMLTDLQNCTVWLQRKKLQTATVQFTIDIWPSFAPHSL